MTSRSFISSLGRIDSTSLHTLFFLHDVHRCLSGLGRVDSTNLHACFFLHDVYNDLSNVGRVDSANLHALLVGTHACFYKVFIVVPGMFSASITTSFQSQWTHSRARQEETKRAAICLRICLPEVRRQRLQCREVVGVGQCRGHREARGHGSGGVDPNSKFRLNSHSSIPVNSNSVVSRRLVILQKSIEFLVVALCQLSRGGRCKDIGPPGRERPPGPQDDPQGLQGLSSPEPNITRPKTHPNTATLGLSGYRLRSAWRRKDHRIIKVTLKATATLWSARPEVRSTSGCASMIIQPRVRTDTA